MSLAEIIEHGAGVYRREVSNMVRCADGFAMSVLATAGAYCHPRPAFPDDLPGPGSPVSADYPGPFTHLEVGFPSARPEPWSDWEEYAENPSQPTVTVYSYVPVAMVQALVEHHGGETDRG